jgi:hypothetical protein
MNCAVSLSLIGGIVLSAGSTLERVRLPVPRPHATPNLPRTIAPAGIEALGSEGVMVVTRTAKVNDRVDDAWPRQAFAVPVPELEPKKAKTKKVATIDPCGTRKKVYARKGRWRCR